ncbi:MAG TPA: hemolysin III family protein [Solirubrobacteraceae bacterium]|nr:hemolysin III family protein [Solirubrobacteraceae bacterium]
MTTNVPEILKPRWRGVLHQYAFFVALGAGAMLVIAADGTRERIAALVYAIGLAGLLGTSALYHRVTWRRPSARMWMRRLDHSMIFVLIAATVTPIALLTLDDPTRTVLLAVAWGGTAAGVALNLLWPRAPKWLSAVVYLLVGWSGAVAIPELAGYAVGALVLVAIGGVLYTAGAIIYATERPNPSPRVFGYHEIFHALVVGAAALHFAAISLIVL